VPRTIQAVLISGGRETGGIASFAVALAAGFEDLGLQAEVVSPAEIVHRRKELQDRRILKILSTTAVFLAPICSQVICVAHGFPLPAAQGWKRTLAILASFKLANILPACRLVAVSDYVAVHLRGVYNFRVDAVIRNPVHSSFIQGGDHHEERRYITYVGRLHPAKNIAHLLPVLRRLLEDDPSLRIGIIGDGPLRSALQAQAAGDPRVEFHGSLERADVRSWLRKTRVFVSGNAMEPFGITYLEALSQGCAVAMPACGGGLEIAADLIGSQVQLLPLSFELTASLAALRRAARARSVPMSMDGYRAAEVARSYLSLAQ